jgi:hypothetical protein
MRDEVRCRLTPTIIYMPPEAASERALHGVSQSPRVVSLLRLLFACTSERLQNAAGRHRLKRIPHGAWRIATAPMSQEAARAYFQTHRERSRIGVRDDIEKKPHAVQGAQASDYNIMPRSAPLKRIPHGARHIATAPMSQEAARTHFQTHRERSRIGVRDDIEKKPHAVRGAQAPIIT